MNGQVRILTAALHQIFIIMVDGNRSSYRSIFKASTLLGGVQIYQVLIQIIKSKVIAILLGPAGVGVMGLYQSGLQLIQQLTNMGLAKSAVRDIAEAYGTQDSICIARTTKVTRRLVWITGALGLVVVVIVSPLLSKSAFGNYDYTIPFVYLSVTLLFDQLCSGQKVILQGMRKLKVLAKCSSIGATFGLITSVPLYYLLGIKGIVPTLILNSICQFLLSWFYTRKIKYETVQLSAKQTFIQGRQMLIMGISMSISGVLGTGVAFIIRSYIQSIGGLNDVGLYQAGFIIMNTYVGLVMNAISTDYYPRLAAVNKDNQKCRETVIQQGEIGTLILAPMLSACLIFMPFVLQILYSDQFLYANEYISWSCVGMLLRLASWVISYLFVAKAESKLFMLNEILANLYTLLFSIIGYKLWGLQGIGAAFALNYLIYFIQVYLIAKYRYQFKLSISFLRCFSIQITILILCLCNVLLFEGFEKYAVGVLLICISCYHSFIGLNQRMDFVSVVKNKLRK